MTIITLSNGKKVGNFSSPHPFTFEDGSILPAVSNEEAERLKVTFHEKEVNDKGDILLTFTISKIVEEAMMIWMELYRNKEVDVIFCPLPMIHALKRRWTEEECILMPFRTIRMEDRIKKLVSIHKQCI